MKYSSSYPATFYGRLGVVTYTPGKTNSEFTWLNGEVIDVLELDSNNIEVVRNPNLRANLNVATVKLRRERNGKMFINVLGSIFHPGTPEYDERHELLSKYGFERLENKKENIRSIHN